MTHERSISAFDQRNLHLGAVARGQRSAPLVILTPEGGLQRAAQRLRTVGCWNVELENLEWALPVDVGRITTRATDEQAANIFCLAWAEIRDRLHVAGGKAVFWEPATAVGDPLPSVAITWVELQKPRPWLELAELEGGRRLLVPASTSAQGITDPRLQVAYEARHIVIGTSARILRMQDGLAELAHFAILKPEPEGWIRAGTLDAGAARAVREGFQSFPQTDMAGQVLIDPSETAR